MEDPETVVESLRPLPSTELHHLAEALREDKRAAPGTDNGFRAVALVALIDGTELAEVSRRDAAINGAP